MQPRRTGLLLPLAQVFLAVIAGCSQRDSEPIGASSPPTGLPTNSSNALLAPDNLYSGLRQVETLPLLQQAPANSASNEEPGEIVQARYRPPAGASGAGDAKSNIRVELGRAQDYSWLQGELFFSSVRGVWRLRYAAAEDDDPYGGSVTLKDLPANLPLETGQRIRVSGHLVNPGSMEPSPLYHVDQVEPLSIP